MNDFSPKEDFKKLEPEVAKELQAQSKSKWLHIAATFSLSDLVFSGATSEQLKGANMFVNRLLNLAETNEPPLKFPQKTLEEITEPTVKK